MKKAYKEMRLDEIHLLDRLEGNLKELVELTKIRGRWSDYPRKRVAEVSSRAKWLQRAIANLRVEIGQREWKPGEPTDEELDSICEKMG